ncbi:MAG TPA: tripartite tricarboxylate transporter permease [Rhizobiaceae bacterium]|nr:tripartite tricarboxylate transporter permease [Rhizobiaceae bacterium]
MDADFLSRLALGFQTALSLENIGLAFLGCLLGTLAGVLPGVGSIATITILLPLTFGLDPVGGLIMLAGIYYGAQYGGSTTAVLVNIPGEASSVVTTLDGHQMARQGRAGKALGIAAIASFVAGCVSTLLIATLAAPLTAAALLFGPKENFALMLMGLTLVVVLARGSIAKAAAMMLLGVILSAVGIDLQTGEPRMTFGTMMLADGIDVAVLAIGVFGFSEVLRSLELPTMRHLVKTDLGSLLPDRADLARSTGAIGRGTLVGSVLGVLPGAGNLLGSFASYALEKRISKTPERFGKGAIEGVAGPEAANNAGAQMSFIPLLMLGFPANAVMALMAGAMMIQGIVPGPQVITRDPALFWGLIASMWIGNLILLIINLPLVGVWVKLLNVPYRLLFPAVVLFSCLGLYSVSNSATPVVFAAAFAIAGYVLMKLDFEMTPLILGFVLGPLIEDNFRRAMIIARGDLTTFVTTPISATLLLIAMIFLVLGALPAIQRRREKLPVDE